jgi:hypothetical protein
MCITITTSHPISFFLDEFFSTIRAGTLSHILTSNLPNYIIP